MEKEEFEKENTRTWLVLEGGGNVPREDVEPPKCGEIL